MQRQWTPLFQLTPILLPLLESEEEEPPRLERPMTALRVEIDVPPVTDEGRTARSA